VRGYSRMCPGRNLSPRSFDRRTVSRPCTWACSRIRNCLPGTSWVRTNSDLGHVVGRGWRIKYSQWTVIYMSVEPLELLKRNTTRRGDAEGKSIRNVYTSYSTKIARPSKVGKPSLNRGPSQHVSDSSNGATLGRHSHLHAMEFIENTM
jgi:hypothetical protein